ncbi:retinal-specific ATP-binding cassette transporter [Fopius arisanus]|uniref:Retinal-specific ATP-binding cassette transporter n=2 Tax=Fopius arisanus TaxID=64838 RepID=A0A9R1TD16_9HYME|nr:PREDICTED: retinal-specific ATP-binding cassette transporter-like [Fopius arisanus]XP_011306964.1 PREDICTED: retinal-specific ATP-binding cassette transporter-like [Fopius arisanus]XP_011306965.1 PREDICTED: retinal-specific ATP-binding cassette transporter-like [Fopius arisanus]XP_011306967.1 PREDICTED: retinal-specific ATP-binding cassette transporter-like [Fopius arisanus]XP_011306968.1 PREDICTED: retinal-specific ATP-binding cassette transporter-like [Fopius arisanus]XP_011306969.1 PREDI
MNETIRIFFILLMKNWHVRKKCWVRTIVVQIIIPIGFFLIAQTIRLLSDNSAKYVNKITYHEIQSKQNILNYRCGLNNMNYHEIQSKQSLQNRTCRLNILRFTPETSATIDLIRYTSMCLSEYTINSPVNFSGAVDEQTMVKDLTQDQVGDVPVESLGIVFETKLDDSVPINFKYKFRTKGALETNLYDAEENGNMANRLMLPPTVVPLQLCLDEAYINWVSQTSSGAVKYSPKISIQQMPYPPYTKVDRGTTIGGKIFSETIKFVFLIILCIEIAYPAIEKNIGINILMSVNGVTAKMNLLSWFTSAAVFSTFYLAPFVIIMRHFMPPEVVPFLSFGDPFIVWFVLLVNLCHTISFGYHMSSHFWKPSNGIFATFVFLAVLNNISNFATSAAIRHTFLYIGLICPSILLQRMFEEITVYESKLVGISWSNMFTVSSADVPSEGSVGVMLIFSIIGILFNFCMALYTYAVRPGKYGVSRNPIPCFRHDRNMEYNEKEIDFGRINSRTEFEQIPEGTFEAGIRIRDLKKTYTKGFIKPSKVDALKGVSMDFYKSQITVLLGHNGAGKTTMMSILSGLTDLTEGAILIDGKNIQRDPSTIRNNIGLCPQENMVFPELTVHQQLFFFGTLKSRNKTRNQLNSEIDTLLEKVNLTEKRNFTPKQLSGGQKRRLCLAMAVIGDGNVLILDEPTSGMDAESKREVWDIILKMRGEKTIIISTHDMEEADILGDRIAIMHTGKLKSYGTSMFLKKLYGDGQVEVTLSVEPWCDSSKVIQEIGVSAQLLNQDEGKMVLAIPQVESLPQTLDHLESSRKTLGITGMSVSIITLEQVFLRVTRDDADTVESKEQIGYSGKATGLEYLRQCFFAFFQKKFTSIQKNMMLFWLSLLLPCLACTIMLTAFAGRPKQGTPISLTLKSYNSPSALIKSPYNAVDNMYAKSVNQFGGETEIISQKSMSVTNALLKAADDDIGKYRNKYIVSAEINGTGADMKANGFYSGTAYLGIPITLNTLSNAFLKAVTENESHKIEASIQQIPSSWAIQQTDVADGWMITVAIIIYLAPAIGLHITQPLEEARSGIKQLQNMTGASKLAYWACMFLFDYIQYVLSILLLLASFVLVDQSLEMKFYHETEILVFAELMLLFGLSMLPFIYCISFLRKSLNATMIFQSVAPSVLGLMEMILTTVEMKWDNEIFKGFRHVQSKLFQVFPFLSFIQGHATFFTVVSKNARCRRMTDEFITVSCIIKDPCCGRQCTNGDCKNPFPYFDDNPAKTSPNLSTSMIYLTGSFFLFSGIIFIVEQRLVQRIVRKIVRKHFQRDVFTEMDELVKKERTIVADEVRKKINSINDGESENVFLVHDLKKRYGKFDVVKGISFRVKESECFGLLGVNGAGKSTTFRMLTGEEMPNGGQMWLRNFNIESSRVEYLREMGYCPQQDAIMGNLNTWDHLYLFARLRGVPKDQVQDVVEKWIRKLNLTACADQPSNTYSGGNKRRLNIAIALIGNPSLVLMDEPTTGVDPAARRSLWNTLKICQASGQSIILTSHSMEECEVLCNRLVIMVKGQLVCVGASQELKQRFGAGYNIHVKLFPNRTYDDVEDIKKKIEINLRCKLTDENSGFLNYHVTDSIATWTQMYSLLHELKNDYSCIEDFAVLSSTLEQLFIQFARLSVGGQLNNGYVHEELHKQNHTEAPV